MIGNTILHYRIIEKLGAGGMGIVFKARDLHLDRFVAIKVLPPGKVSDPERKRRFVQEAKAASALNHPNIITVHDIASDAGQDFIVMEYIEGKALDQLIGRKGLKVNEALGYAAQIADGLAKAHAAGIIHRDLKPSNIMVSDDGVVKLLDFGLAKLTDALSADELAPGQTASRTAELQTDEGTIVGTVAYMSPEQAEGRKVDPRSDIFSFGSVLYEMITGRQAFHRDSKLATLAAIKSEDPAPAAEVFAALPPQVEEVLGRCLRKDPQRRWQSASDLKVVLQDLKEESDSGKLRVIASSPARRRPWGLLIAVAGVAAVVVAFVIWMLVYRPAPQTEVQLARLTYDSGVTAAPAISPDGRLVAFASNRGGNANPDIWVQQISGGKPVQLTNNPATDTNPSFSPDGSQVVFWSQREGGGLFIVDTLGGEMQGSEARKVSDRGNLPRISPDGEFISYVDAPVSPDLSPTKMYLVSRQGGAPKPFQPEFSVNAATSGSAPVWSPDGKYLLFSGTRNGDSGTMDWWVAPVGDGPAIRTNAKPNLSLLLLGSWDYPCAWMGDFVYYISGTTVEGINIFRVRISPGDFQVTGKPEPLTAGTGMQMSASVARDGRMVFASMNFTMNIWSLDAAPDQGTTSGGPVQITQDQTAKWEPFISRDGSKLAYVSFAGLRTSQAQIRVRDMAGSRETAITPNPGATSVLLLGKPVLNADGSMVAYRDRAAKGYGFYLMGTGAASGREICTGCEVRDFFSDPDSALIDYTPGLLVRQNLLTGNRTVLIEGGANRLLSASLSGDDRWLAMAMRRPDGKVAIYVAAVRDQAVPEKEWVLICEDNQFVGSPKWSPAGKLLYYLSSRDGECAIWAQRLDPAIRKPVGSPFVVFRPNVAGRSLNVPAGNARIGVAPDRLIFYMAEGRGNIYMATLKPR